MGSKSEQESGQPPESISMAVRLYRPLDSGRSDSTVLIESGGVSIYHLPLGFIWRAAEGTFP
jgi:hypothetical protein